MTSSSPAGRGDRRFDTGVVGRSPAVCSVAVPLLLAGVLIVLILGLVLAWTSRSRPLALATPYHAVLLTNGSVYFGKLDGYGTPAPVLTDAFYVVSRSDPNTKQVSNVLVKRGKELHGPDRMYINPNQIVFVETVGPTSQIAQLISKSAGQKLPATPSGRLADGWELSPTDRRERRGRVPPRPRTGAPNLASASRQRGKWLARSASCRNWTLDGSLARCGPWGVPP